MGMDYVCLTMQVKTIKQTMLFSLLLFQFQKISFMAMLFTSFSFMSRTNLLSGIGSDTMALVYVLRN